MTYKHFTNAELMCNCGCGAVPMDEEFMARLDEVREQYGKPIYISSGYRCPEYNAKISKTGTTGAHTTGKAVDMAISGLDAYRLIEIAMKLRFTGIGIQQRGDWEKRFIHLDLLDLGATRPRIWSY